MFEQMPKFSEVPIGIPFIIADKKAPNAFGFFVIKLGNNELLECSLYSLHNDYYMINEMERSPEWFDYHYHVIDIDENFKIEYNNKFAAQKFLKLLCK